MKLLFSLVIFVATTEAFMRTRFRALKCSSLNESLASIKCFLKPYSRDYVSMNYVETRKVQYEKPIEVKSLNFSELDNLQNLHSLNLNLVFVTEQFITKYSTMNSNGAASLMGHRIT